MSGVRFQAAADGRALRRRLELGDSNDGFVVIKAGLKEEDEVVLNPTAFIEEAKSAAFKTFEEPVPPEPNAERASSKRHPILSFRIDQAPLPDGLEYFRNASQWLDASSTGVERALPRLVDAVKNARRKPAAATHGSHGPSVVTKASARPSRWFVALGVAIAAALAYLAVDKIWLSKRSDAEPASTEATSALPADSTSAPAIPENSIAVLPFSDLSEKSDQEYFSDGLSEELIDHLAKRSR